MEFFGDIFGGFMVMLFILGFFLVVLWFILPFVIFAMKGKLDSAHLLLENIDRRLAAIEKEQMSPCLPPQEDADRPANIPS
jgi:hypothetical protein